MTSEAKVLIPEKEWLIRNGESKIGSISKEKKEFIFLRKGLRIKFRDLSEIQSQYGIEIPEHLLKKTKKVNSNFDADYSIYEFPCSSKPFEPVYNLKKRLPIFAKSSKSKSRYCAGYYVIKFRKGWVKSFCPKLITLERYPYYGPFKTETEMKQTLNAVNKT